MSSIKRGDWIKYTISYWERDVRKTSTVLAQVFSSTKTKGLGTVTGCSGIHYNFHQDGTPNKTVTGIYSTAVLVTEEEKEEYGCSPALLCVVVREEDSTPKGLGT
jgi:hypothetical protein